MNQAYIIFTVSGRRYTYDGSLPPPFSESASEYPDSLFADEKEPGDELPTARFEIEQLGGKIIEIHGARPSGAILWADWKNPVFN